MDLSHVTAITSLIAVVSCKSDHETSAWIFPSAVTCTCRMVGVHVGSTTTLVTAVSPACCRLCRVGVCQSHPGTRLFFYRRNRKTVLRGRLSKGSQYLPWTHSRTSALWRCWYHRSGVSLRVSRSHTHRLPPEVPWVCPNRRVVGAAPCPSSLGEEQV